MIPLAKVIEDAKALLETNGVKPTWICLSPNAHEALVSELRKRTGAKRVRGTRIFEIMGLRVDIDEDCPQGGAYLGGDET